MVLSLSISIMNALRWHYRLYVVSESPHPPTYKSVPRKKYIVCFD